MSGARRQLLGSFGGAGDTPGDTQDASAAMHAAGAIASMFPSTQNYRGSLLANDGNEDSTAQGGAAPGGGGAAPAAVSDDDEDAVAADAETAEAGGSGVAAAELDEELRAPLSPARSLVSLGCLLCHVVQSLLVARWQCWVPCRG